ncbi:TetR/AcrR family transcriptional regulator [Nocardioides sp. L-11A]|uniref:TetR/AcrR family transcriptional regulator n=1 Tax=Nocardioides sp. L-11A TaxID=3043848 RepID=UPI00249B54D8|nr:TetR/AcrR family transcriptional regulator [Nocardioides sp. L-11A]
MALAKFTSDGILDACAEEVLANGGDVRIADIASRLGAPTGSIYHRFGSRQELLVRLWLRSVGRFHVDYLAAGDQDDPERALLAMAECVVAFSRDHQLDAVAMTLYRHSRLVLTAPESCREDVENINVGIHDRLAVLAERRYEHTTERHRFLVRLAAAESPYGLVRPYLWNSVPASLPEAVVASSRAILALGD